MSNLIITTVGTSIISNKLYPQGFEVKIKQLINKDESLGIKYEDAFIDETYKKIKDMLYNKKYNDLPAEIDSLMVSKKELKLSGDDMIALISTDTEAGKLCSKVNKKVLEASGWRNVLGPIVITGLRTRKIKEQEDISETFKHAGLKNLKEAINGLNPQSYENKYFNITGGFKAVLPFVTILAFEKRMTLIYLYEDSNDLIVIDPPEPDKFYCSFDEVIKKARRINRPLLSW